MKVRNLLLAVAGMFFISATASAGILLDPYVGFGAGKGKFTSPAASEFDLGGTEIGARVAYSIPLFFFGADYVMVSGKTKVSSGAGVDSDLSANALYLMVGAHIPLLRGYLGYSVMGSSTIKSSGTETTYTGSSMKVGVGFTGLPFIALNLEYYRDTFNKFKNATTDGTADGTSDSYFLTVSLPLDF